MAFRMALQWAAIMNRRPFEWDAEKDRTNREKHHVSFTEAQEAFLDPHRVIARDLEHSQAEERYYCFGIVKGGVLTVRFTYRGKVIRILRRRLLAQRQGHL